MDQVNAVVVGYGYAGRCFHSYLSGLEPALNLYGVVSSRPEARRQIGRELGVRTFETFGEALVDDDVDLVVLATPNDLHASQAITALEAGKHVVTDKPMCFDAKEADSMMAAATPETGRLDRLGTIDTPASRSTSWTEPIRLDNLYDQVKNWLFYGHTFAMSSIDDATYAVGLFRDAGGSCIVDVTVVGMGRDPEGLQIVSRRTGVHIVLATGFYLDTYHPSSTEDMSEAELADFMIAEIEDGVHPGGAKPGMIGEMGYRLGHPLILSINPAHNPL